MTDVGVGYVELVPTTKGFSSKASQQLGAGLEGPARMAGDRAGDKFGEGVEDGVGRAGGRFKSAAGRAGEVFKKAFVGVGLAAGVTLAAGLTAGIENERIEDKLVAQLGGGEWAEEAAGVAASLYGDAFGDGMADTADAVKQVLQAGILAEDELGTEALEKLTAQALTFSDVLDQDLNMSLQAVDNMLASGLAGSAEEAFDILTKGVQGGVDASGDLTEVFQEYSTLFRDIGLDASDATGLLSLGLQAGARDADTVADSLKEFAIRAQDGSTAAAAGFEAIGLDAAKMTAAVAEGGPAARDALDQVLKGLNQMEDPAARNAAAVALFGTKAEDLGDALFNLDLDRAGMVMQGQQGTVDQLGSAYENAATRIESFKRRGLQALTNFIGDKVIPIVDRLIDVIGPGLSRAFDGISTAASLVGELATTFKAAFDTGETFGGGALFETFQQLGVMARDAVDMFRSAWEPFSDWLAENGEIIRGALAGIGIAIMTLLIPALIGMVAPMVAAVAPFVALGLAAAAIGAGLVWAYENVEEFRAIVDTALPAIVELMTSSFDLILAAIDRAVSIGSWLWENFGDLLVDAASIAMGILGGVIQGGLDIVVGIVQLATAVLRGDWSAAWDAVKQILGGALTIVKTLIRGAFDTVVLVARIGWRLFKTVTITALTAAGRFVADKIGDIVGYFRRLPGRIRSAVGTLASAITSPFRSAFNGVRSLWNRTAGGFGFSIPDWIPKVGGKSFSIPKMHTGGVFRAPAGQSEGLALLLDGEVVTNPAEDPIASVASPAPAPAPALRLDPAGRDLFLEWIRQTVRYEGGGDVQLAFGEIGAR